MIRPSYNLNKRFSKKEDAELMKAIKEVGLDWVKIAGIFPERCPMSLKNRYYTLIKKKKSPASPKKAWNPKENSKKSCAGLKKKIVKEPTKDNQIVIKTEETNESEETAEEEMYSDDVLRMPIKNLVLEDTPDFLKFLESLV